MILLYFYRRSLRLCVSASLRLIHHLRGALAVPFLIVGAEGGPARVADSRASGVIGTFRNGRRAQIAAPALRINPSALRGYRNLLLDGRALARRAFDGARSAHQYLK